MAFGKTLITLPAPPVQPRRLLDVISRLPGADGNTERWLMGVTWEPAQMCRKLHIDDEEICTETNMDVTPNECAQWEEQDPFRISDAFSASTLNYTVAEVETMLTTEYNRLISAAFATELLDGAGSGVRSLSSIATSADRAVFGTAALPIAVALAVLEAEIADRLQGGVGYIHLPPGMLGLACDSYGLVLSGDRWETAAGNIVISDAGYYRPPAPHGQAQATDDEDWIYASGPIFYESTSPTSIGTTSTTFEQAEVVAANPGRDNTVLTRNQFTQYLAGFGILVFDTCPVTAVLASYDVCCGEGGGFGS